MKRGIKAVSVLIAVLLAVSVLPARQDVYAADDSVRTSVDELLASGEYAEGEAIVIVRKGALLDGEIIANVSPDAVEQTIEQTGSAQGALAMHSLEFHTVSSPDMIQILYSKRNSM
ncbi:MAG: hypothetical protein IKG08_09195 [Eubacterium sp.]|nr:hypothetical protein [Eubacterium sp.]